MKAPLDQAIKRAVLHLANIHAARREAVLRVEPANAIRQEEDFAVTMGMSSENFRRQVVDHALLRMQPGDHRAGPERHELERTLERVLGDISTKVVSRSHAARPPRAGEVSRF